MTVKFLRGARPMGACIFDAMSVGKEPESRPIKISNWQPSDKEIREGTWTLSDLVYHDEIGKHSGDLDRTFVRATYQPKCSDRSIIWTLVWGYPKGRIQMNRPNMKSAVRSASPISRAINSMLDCETPFSANEVLTRIHEVSSGVRTSTSSKIAYFAGIKTREGVCLILDEKVIASILYNRFDQLRPLSRKMLPAPPATYSCLGAQIVDATKRQEAIYADYVRCLNRLAQQRGIAPDMLEGFLFANAPSRPTMKEINDEWDAIRGKSRRKRASHL